MYQRLKKAGITWNESLKNYEGAYILDISRSKVSNLWFLKGMPLTRLNLYDTPVSDLSPLCGMPLRDLFLNRTKVSDLTPLRRLPLELLVITETPVEDITPLKDLALKWFYFDSKRVSIGVDVLRNMKSLQLINGYPPSKFWPQYEALRKAERSMDNLLKTNKDQRMLVN